MRVIVGISGGKASAWCAQYCLNKYNKDNVILYFNDTKWEHPDLYRFLKDLESYLNHPITEHSHGSSPEELFYQQRALASDRMPFCSKILKAYQLRKFIQDGDIIVFGIGLDEKHRAERISTVYNDIARKRKINLQVSFPIIENNVTREEIDTWLQETGIEEPYLYKLGFTHNNCSGGCVRAGKKQWKKLYELLPEVYADRERVEREVGEFLGKDIHFLKDETLEHFRNRIDSGNLTSYYKR